MCELDWNGFGWTQLELLEVAEAAGVVEAVGFAEFAGFAVRQHLD